MSNATRQRIKKADRYRLVARRIERLEAFAACIAIKDEFSPFTPYSVVDEVNDWRRLFGPYHVKDEELCGGNFGFFLHRAADERKIARSALTDWRVLSLCFMAAMVEAGDA